MKEFTSALDDIEAEDAGTAEEERYVEFMLDGREMRAYQPTDGQLAFMLASLGRGQTSEGRFASIINIMLETLRPEDKDYMESRLLTRGPNQLKVAMIEEIFEHLSSEWFARPTPPPSVSASSQPTDGPKSKARTTKSNSSD